MKRLILKLLLFAVVLSAILYVFTIRGRNINSKDTLGVGNALATQQARLDQTSLWAEEDIKPGQPGRADRGCFPIGNGRVFTTMGLYDPPNTLENTLAPHYQKTSGLLGQQAMVLVVEGKRVQLADCSVRRVRGTGIVRTSGSAGGLRLETVDFVPPDLPVIVRIITVRPPEHGLVRGVAVEAAFSGVTPERDGANVMLSRGRISILPRFLGSRTRWIIPKESPEPAGLKGKGTSRAQESAILRLPLGTVSAKRGPVTRIFVVAFGMTREDAQKALDDAAAQGSALLEKTLEFWEKWQEGTTQLACDNSQRVVDFLEDQKVIIKTQQAELGGYSPMYQYTYCWIRDSNGPVRYMLDIGQFDDVKRYLDFHWRACAKLGEVPNAIALDQDVSGPTPKVDWAKAKVPAAEIASFVVLQHYWYYLHSGDIILLKEHYPYLKRCLLGQKLTEGYHLPFHGDETYRFPGYMLFPQKGTPIDYVDLDLLSADSAFEFVAAAEGLAEVADRLGEKTDASRFKMLAKKVRHATENCYWMPDRGYYAPAMSDVSGQLHQEPFANINLRPLWVRYAAADERARDNVLNALAYLWRESGPVKTTPTFGYYVGMTPGYVLYNLAAIDHPAAEKALEDILKAAEPSAGFAEMNTPEDKPSVEIWGRNRIRPWEGGINAQAVLYYLTGFEPDAPDKSVRLCPHIPPGSKQMKASNLRVGRSQLSLECENTGQTMEYDIRVKGEHGLEVKLVASLPGPGVVQEGGPSSAHSVPAGPGLRHQLTLSRHLTPGQVWHVVVEYNAKGELKPTLTPKRFQYRAPSVPAVDVVVFTQRKEIVEKWRAEGPTLVLDPRITLPAEMVAKLIETARNKGCDRLVLDWHSLPGTCKKMKFWLEGPVHAAISGFEATGGKVTWLGTRADAQPWPVVSVRSDL